ncbi:hypothetical protein WAI453_013026 [Rhynchosporium graminicola]
MSFSQYNSQLDAFDSYHKVQETHHSTLNGPALPALGHALAGSTGTAIANLAIYPLDLVITRLQVQRSLRTSSKFADEGEYEGVLDAFEKIYNKEGGISAFYGGVLQDTGKSIADSFLFFLFYNYLRSNRLQKKGSNATTLPALDELGVGAFAGALSKLFTTPISNIVTRKQTASMIAARSSSYSRQPTVSDIASQIRSEKGLQGFWSGYSASLVLTLNPSITFFLYETFKRTLLPRYRRDDPGARITFLMAAFSKAIASAITYPFALAKTRAQTSSKPPVDEDDAKIVVEEVEKSGKSRDRSDAETAGQDAKRLAKDSTVFATIIRIYRTEGASALYEGVWGEIFKGFLSHGTTMIIKEQIHKLIISTYYMILKALNKYPSPTELAKQAGNAVQDAGQYVKNAGEKGGDILKEGYENVAERVGITTESFGVMANNTTEVARNATDFSAKQAGNLLGNAQEQLGGKIEEAGHALKSSEVKAIKKND